MRVLVTFSGHSFNSVESFKGGFYVSAVSLDDAHNKAEKILSTINIEPHLLGCFNELSDEFNEWPLDTFKGLNGIIKCTGQYINTGETFEWGAILKKGRLSGIIELYESEAQCLKAL